MYSRLQQSNTISNQEETCKYIEWSYKEMFNPETWANTKAITQKFAKLSCPGQKDILQPTSSLSDSHKDIPEEILRFVNVSS